MHTDCGLLHPALRTDTLLWDARATTHHCAGVKMTLEAVQVHTKHQECNCTFSNRVVQRLDRTCMNCGVLNDIRSVHHMDLEISVVANCEVNCALLTRSRARKAEIEAALAANPLRCLASPTNLPVAGFAFHELSNTQRLAHMISSLSLPENEHGIRC
ncbi:hypothetical protein HII31_08383 [Pseudocercospora fuligena]|uniref:Uncharacterized protein n=1 Tax=Pseudocercospora fuligena TaxID=685502 RepID=A0A8H6RG02_9PEZI|nr:hypothetical protein HII31_08383 [Pseudocercospora fuligena]